MSRLDVSDIASRLAWTFVQALAATLVAVDAADMNAQALKVAAVAAGLSAIKTVVAQLVGPRGHDPSA